MDYDFLRQYLKNNKITRKQFAESIGVSIFDVNNWFSREPKRFPDDIAIKISTVYHIPLEKLIGMKMLSHEEAMAYFAGTVEDAQEQESDLLAHFRKLNHDGREKAIDAVETLAKVPEYRKKE